METVVEALAREVERLPDDLAHHEIAALFGVFDALAARLSAAVGRVDPGADGAVSVRQWLRARARRSDAEAAVWVRRAERVGRCPVVAARGGPGSCRAVRSMPWWPGSRTAPRACSPRRRPRWWR